MDDGAICIPNIGVKNRRRRRNLGLAGLVASSAMGLVLLLMGVGFWVRLLLFFPFYGGMVGYFQAREKTWVRLATQGLRDMDDGAQKIEDVAILAQVRKQARKVVIESVIAGAIFALIFAIIPV